MPQDHDRPEAESHIAGGASPGGGAEKDVLELRSEMRSDAPAAVAASTGLSTSPSKEEKPQGGGSTELVPVLGSYGGTAIARRDAGPSSAAFAAEQLLPVLKGAAAGAPVRLHTLADLRLTLRVTASIWARPEIVAERRTGCAPVGPVEETAEAAAAALSPLAEAELARGRGLATLRENVTADPWTALSGLQGDDLGPVLAESRSVVTRCTDCAGAGGFACIDCSGVGRRVCASCAGSGQVNEACPSCRLAASGGDSKVALDPKNAWKFLLDQVSSGGEGGRTAERTVAGAQEGDVARKDCPDCRGVGVRRTDCANCAGAGERRCQSCAGSGRVVCTPCAGTGFLTDIYSGRARYERSLHLALSTGEANNDAPAEAAEAIRRSWDALIAARAFTPRLVGFQSSGFAAQAVFEADLPLSRLRAVIGARSPRMTLDFWAAGEPAMLLDPPKALDTLHRRAVDRARVATREGRRQVASALSDLACGRAALRAAARRDRDLPPGAFGPLASDGENARMLDLARAAHGAVGWREERQVWTAAALLAAPAGLLAAQGLSVPAGMAVAPIAAAFTPEAYLAPDASPFWDTFGAVWALIVASAPFIILWLLAGSVATWVYRRATRRTLGFARSRSAGRLFFGRAPLVALAGAATLYLTGLGVGAPEPPADSPRSRGGTLQAAAVATEGKKPGDDRGSSVTVAAFGGGDELNAFAALTPVDSEWRSNGTRLAVISGDGEAVLSARCEQRVALFRLDTTGDAPWREKNPPGLAWRTERGGLHVNRLEMRADRSGAVAPEWRASDGAVRALRRNSSLLINWATGKRSAQHEFTLRGSSKALNDVMDSCR